jgi:hypothetical protein
MPIGAILAAGGIGAAGSIYAADQEGKAAKNASALETQMYNQTRADLAPYMQGGTMALSALNKFIGLTPNGLSGDSVLTKPFTSTMQQNMPGYQWQLGQGLQGVLANQSALGGLNSGTTLKALNNYAQGLASTNYQQQFQDYQQQLQLPLSVLGNLASSGQSAAAGVGGLGQGYAGMIGGNITGAGNSAAAGTVGAVNNLTGGTSDAVNSYLMWRLLNQAPQTATLMSPGAAMSGGGF